jgi:hypothetical protein
MKRLIAASALAATLLGASAPPAHAGTSTDIALGLASFAVFNQVVAPFLNPHRPEAAEHRREVVHQTVVARPAVVYYEAPVVYQAPPPAYPTVVQYPHGRYELRLQGQQYVWVWIPAVPLVPPPPPPPPAS